MALSFRRGSCLAPTDASLLPLPEGVHLGRPVLLRSWPDEQGDSPGAGVGECVGSGPLSEALEGL